VVGASLARDGTRALANEAGRMKSCASALLLIVLLTRRCGYD
jgi:hypothetical protein